MKQNEMQSRVKIGKGMYAFDVPVRPVLSRKMRIWQQARRDEIARLLDEQRGSERANPQRRGRS